MVGGVGGWVQKGTAAPRPPRKGPGRWGVDGSSLCPGVWWEKGVGREVEMLRC